VPHGIQNIKLSLKIGFTLLGVMKHKIWIFEVELVNFTGFNKDKATRKYFDMGPVSNDRYLNNEQIEI
jgi:hypothetical protein